MTSGLEADLHSLAIVEPRLRSRLEVISRADGAATPAAAALVAHARRHFG
jgi:hypothetical protein